MYGIGLQLTSTTTIGGSYSPASLFTANEVGYIYDYNDAANLDWRYNFATGSADPTNFAIWTVGGTTNGITVSRVGAGFDTDGLPYDDYTVSGTATAADRRFFTSGFRTPSTMGEQWAVSAIVQRTAGSAPPAGCGLSLDVLGETAPTTYIEGGGNLGNPVAPSSATTVVRTYTLANVVSNQASAVLTVETANGATVNYTIRIKALQFERGAVRRAYQPITDLTTEVRTRFPNATLYQDIAGTQPVTTAGQAVALKLSKERALALGPELTTNGDFSDGATGWSFTGAAPLPTVVGGAATFVGGAASNRFIGQANKLVIGRTYLVSATVTVSAGTIGPDMTGYAANVSVSGTYTWRLQASITTLSFIATNNFAGTIDNISVRELVGNHANQSDAAKRPLYSLLPSNGVRNLANGSAAPSDVAIWPASTVRNGITATKVGSGFDTDGLPYVDLRFQGTASGTFHEIAFNYLPTPAASGQSWTCSAIMRVIGGSTANTSGLTVRVQELDAADGFIDNSVSDRVTASVDTISISTNAIATGVKVRALVELAFTTATSIDVTYRVKALQFELGSSRTAYQFNYAATNIAQPPFTQVGALLYDGVDDFMVTPAINFQSYTWDGQARRNFAFGSAQPTNDAFWPSTNTQNGITSTKVASGFDADGLPYVDVRYQGTATSTFHGGAYEFNNSFTDAVLSQTYTASGICRVLSGSLANCSFILSVVELTAANAYITETSSAQVPTASDTLLTATRTLNQGTMAKTRTAVVLTFANAAVIDVTVRIKGFQFERAAARTAWQGTGTDKVFLTHGVRKTSDVATAAVVELGNGSGITNVFSLFAPSGNGANSYRFACGGSIGASVGTGIFAAAPDTSVITGVGDIPGDSIILRRNGTQVASFAGDQGTGNFSNASIYFGARAGTGLFFKGYEFSSICRSAFANPAQTVSAEEWVRQRTAGAY